MSNIFKLVYSNSETGELGRLPDFAIVNIGGTIGPTFTVGGKPLLFADGSTTDGSASGVSVSLQGAYNASATPAIINLVAGKDLILNALNNKAFQFDASTGKVTITGDLEVLGSSSVIEGTISNVDQIRISAPNGATSSLLIEPMAGVMMGTDIVRIHHQNGELPAFVINSDGNTYIRTLNVGGIDFSAFYAAFSTHISTSHGTRHSADQISVVPLTNLPGENVQEVLEAIDSFITNSGGTGGSVTSVEVTSDDMEVTGSPITTAGTIDLQLKTVPISKGGTGATTASAAINALVPVQAGQDGKVLGTDGTSVIWVTPEVPSEDINDLVPPQTGQTGKVLGTDGSTVIWVEPTAATNSAGLFFIDATPSASGIVGNKKYVPGTTPANKVIYEGTTDTDNVTVLLFAEGDSAFYSPTVTITTTPAQAGGPIIASMVEDVNDKRSYHATATLTGLSVNTIVSAVSSTGAMATMMIQRAAAGPALNSLLITTLPGTQTEVKSGDVVSVSGSIANSATYAEIVAGGAAAALSTMTLGAANSAGTGFKTLTGTFIVGTGSGAQTIQARGRSALGTFGALFTSSNTVTLNQTYPVIGTRTITYPDTQQGLKGSEAATVSSTITNFNTVVYSGVNLSITDPSTYSVSKTIARTGGTYSYGVNNYTITATKTSNNAVTTAQTAITIADTAPTAVITISGSPARLFSSPAGTDYTITITASQRLLSAPSMTASSGVWQGAGWSGSGTTWTRVLRILDTSPKGPHLFSALSMTGLAGVPGSVITAGANYTVGGFAARIITFDAFERYHAIGTTVVDFTKVTASYTGSSTLTRRSDTNDVFQSFTIVNASGNFDPTGGYLFISDQAFAGANTSGTLQLTIAEAA